MHEVNRITKYITTDSCVLSKYKDAMVLVVSQGDGERVCESRVFNDQVLVPQLEAASKDAIEEMVKESIKHFELMCGSGRDTVVLDVRWPDGKWGILVAYDGDVEIPTIWSER